MSVKHGAYLVGMSCILCQIHHRLYSYYRLWYTLTCGIAYTDVCVKYAITMCSFPITFTLGIEEIMLMKRLFFIVYRYGKK